MKKVGLVFCILPGLFFTIQNITETRYLTKTEMKQLWAGVTCYSKACKLLGGCGDILNPLKCLGRNPGDSCIACVSGTREYSKCSGSQLPSGKWCEEYTIPFDNGIEGSCVPIGIDPETGQMMLSCVGAIGEEYPTCGNTKYCQNKP